MHSRELLKTDELDLEEAPHVRPAPYTQLTTHCELTQATHTSLGPYSGLPNGGPDPVVIALPYCLSECQGLVTNVRVLALAVSALQPFGIGPAVVEGLSE